MTGGEGKVATYATFNGLRTDTPASKCPPEYSPDCSDIDFAVSGYGTRKPLRVVETMTQNIVAREEFVGRDAVTHIVFLCVDGSLYGDGALLDTVAAGSAMNSVVAYGRIYMAFFTAAGGSDAPRSWDGNNLYRVSQGGPGAAPAVSCISLPAVSLITATSGTTVAIATITPTNPQDVQTGGDGGGDAFDPPPYQTYYTTLTVATSAPHGLSSGNVISISGNTYWNIGVAYVATVLDASTFTIGYQTQDSTVGTGGSVGISAPLLSRKNDEVQAAAATPHGLRVGYKVAIAGVADLSYPISTITTNAAQYPSEAEIAFASNPGFVPGDTISISNVPYVNAGGGVQGYNIANGIASVTTNSAHGLSVGLSVIVSLHTYAPRTVTVDAILSPTVWTYQTEEPNVTDTGGYVHVPFPGAAGDTYTITETPTDTTVRITFSASDYSWIGGDVTFPWNGSFYVDSVTSATTFTYRQSGPDATLQTGSGTVTPQGQISAGEHECCVHFILQDGTITAPSPSTRFTAKVNQYPFVTMAIGPANVKARVLSFTGVNGGDFAMLLIPARAGGLQVSTSTVIQDNTTQSAVVDFPDTALLSATRIDIPGNNLFQCFPLTTPDGVEWYADRLFWKGEKNLMLGMLNMGFDGGTLSGSFAPLGWTVVSGGGSVVQSGFMPVYSVAAGQTGEIKQSCVRNQDGAQIMAENTRYRLRLWVDGPHTGAIVGVISSASASFTATATVLLSGRGYVQADFTADTPASIPDDMTFSLKTIGGAAVHFRDAQMIYRDNPNRWPLAIGSYVQRPGTYDFITGFIGPNDDSTELRAMFRLQESLYFITDRLYYVQTIGTSEPASWDTQGISDDCDAFHSNAVTTGKGFAAWAGFKGAFWFTGGLPTRSSAVIDPTWQQLPQTLCVRNDALAKRVYFAAGTKALVMDYREQELGGDAKWSPLSRAVAWVSISATNGATLAVGQKMYRNDTADGIQDDDFGDIGGYYTFAPVAASTLYQKAYNYLAMRMSGTGIMTPFTFNRGILAVTQTLAAQDLAALGDVVAEYPVNLRGRLMFLRIGQPGLQYSMEELAVAWSFDPNSPLSGTRK